MRISWAVAAPATESAQSAAVAVDNIVFIFPFSPLFYDLSGQITHRLARPVKAFLPNPLHVIEI
jgi:hypothetical protein